MELASYSWVCVMVLLRGPGGAVMVNGFGGAIRKKRALSAPPKVFTVYTLG